MIRVDTSQAIRTMRRELEQFSPSQQGSIIAPALNRAIAAGRTVGGKEVRKAYRISAADVNKASKVTKASRTKQRAEINLSGKFIPLRKFRYRQLKLGVKVGIKKGSNKLIKSAFLAPIGNTVGIFARGRYDGGKFVFRDAATRGRKPYSRRGNKVWPDLPIAQLITTSVPTAFTQPKGMGQVNKRMSEVFTQRLSHEISRRQTKERG